jgi:tetratricopeptide (TPR) repeat protein
LHARGRKLLGEERFADAIEPFTQAIQLDPSLALAYNGRGYALFRLRRYAEAIKDFDEAIRLNPNYANAYLNRSAARRIAGDKTGAEADQLKAREVLQKNR